MLDELVASGTVGVEFRAASTLGEVQWAMDKDWKRFISDWTELRRQEMEVEQDDVDDLVGAMSNWTSVETEDGECEDCIY